MTNTTKSRISNILVSAALAASTALAGCSQTGSGEKTEAGLVLGALAGGLIGSQVGGGDRVAATVIGATAGAAIGGLIGAAMDEEDRQEMERMTQRSFATGSAQDYTSPRTKAHVRVRIVKTTKVSKRICRTASQDVTLSDGKTTSNEVTACRSPNGTWEV